MDSFPLLRSSNHAHQSQDLELAFCTSSAKRASCEIVSNHAMLSGWVLSASAFDWKWWGDMRDVWATFAASNRPRSSRDRIGVS